MLFKNHLVCCYHDRVSHVISSVPAGAECNFSQLYQLTYYTSTFILVYSNPYTWLLVGCSYAVSTQLSMLFKNKVVSLSILEHFQRDSGHLVFYMHLLMTRVYSNTVLETFKVHKFPNTMYIYIYNVPRVMWRHFCFE